MIALVCVVFELPLLPYFDILVEVQLLDYFGWLFHMFRTEVSCLQLEIRLLFNLAILLDWLGNLFDDWCYQWSGCNGFDDASPSLENINDWLSPLFHLHSLATELVEHWLDVRPPWPDITHALVTIMAAVDVSSFSEPVEAWARNQALWVSWLWGQFVSDFGAFVDANSVRVLLLDLVDWLPGLIKEMIV